MKVLTVVGARPQFIKAATVSRLLQGHSSIQEILVHTGQHYDPNMSAVFFEELGIPAPQHHLEVGSGSHGTQTGKMLERLEPIFQEEQPDWVMVYGDTNSTLAGGLAASKLHIPVAHVEAGLRSFNRQMPEEVNRVLTDHLSSLLFAPTATAMSNLEREGIGGDMVRQVGDVMYDAALYFGQRAQSESHIVEVLELKPKQFVLVTIHRAENTDQPARLQAIAEGLLKLSQTYHLVWPVHPRTRRVMEGLGLLEALQGHLLLTEPVSYLDMVQLEQQALLILTDSGGVQKEAYFHQVPCLTLRAETEWVELVELGWNRLVDPARPFDLRIEVQRALEQDRANPAQPYGSGNAAAQIMQALLHASPTGR
ncbi:MAG: UDP-N-acetylglucosamine 2-epimerase (non-hydrolyzing) [Meiothermus sp.]|nr:UDP-N-acetylglucosamine 2-epimerase (non-hydrolyzing) [Meiothermus sp.]